MSRSLRTDPYEIRAVRRSRQRVPIRVTAARPGFFHPASPSDITELLDMLGPKAKYGVRSIELRQSVQIKHGHWFGQTKDHEHFAELYMRRERAGIT